MYLEKDIDFIIPVISADSKGNNLKVFFVCSLDNVGLSACICAQAVDEYHVNNTDVLRKLWES